MHKLFFGILISVLVILALLVGLGALLTRILPLTLFQAAVLVTGASVATSLWLIMIACFIRTMRYLPPWEVDDEEDEEDDEEPLRAPKSQTPRNAPCPCGSGKKYKHCCGSSNL